MIPLDSILLKKRYLDLPEDLIRPVNITPLKNIKIASFNASAARWLNLDIKDNMHEHLAKWLNGELILENQQTVATRYSGHQFGHYVPQLGDGRALLFGEIESINQDLVELQLKGGGVTPFSRQGDGRAVLRSTIREYLCSEAMFALGIPTTRALAIASSDSEVYRESIETGALLLRCANSHIRFGHFENCFYNGEEENSQQLADFVIQHHLPHLANDEKPYAGLLRHAVIETAKLMAHWQSVGFAHGVMNTDNMSILGLTIDYGPYGFLDKFEPDFICNHSDHQGRYAFNRQPDIAYWNLSALAQAMTSLISVDDAKAAIQDFGELFETEYLKLMAGKLGLPDNHPELSKLLNQLFSNMARDKSDYTRIMRALCKIDENSPSLPNDLTGDKNAWQQWLDEYARCLREDTVATSIRQTAMRSRNPKYILRNYIAQEAIELAEKGDFSRVNELLILLQSPYDEHPEMERYAASPPDWSQEIAVSCSS